MQGSSVPARPHNNPNCIRMKRGFTLIEALVSIALIVILLASVHTVLTSNPSSPSSPSSASTIQPTAVDCVRYANTYYKDVPIACRAH